MTFVALDGFLARFMSPVKATDTFVRVRTADATALAGMAAGTMTYLVLRDVVNSEIVTFDNPAGIVSVGQGYSDIPVTRASAGGGTSWNFGCSGEMVYEVTTPVVQAVVNATLAANGIG